MTFFCKIDNIFLQIFLAKYFLLHFVCNCKLQAIFKNWHICKNCILGKLLNLEVLAWKLTELGKVPKTPRGGVLLNSVRPSAGHVYPPFFRTPIFERTSLHSPHFRGWLFKPPIFELEHVYPPFRELYTCFSRFY